jgi:transposase
MDFISRIMQGWAKRRMKGIMDTEKIYVGIDIGKEKIDFAVHTSNEHWSFNNDDAGIAKIVKAIGDMSPSLVVMEATGNYQAPLVAALAIARIVPAVVNHRQVRDSNPQNILPI